MSPSEIVSYGFATSPVVMMNEAHNGMSRCARTRRIGRESLPMSPSRRSFAPEQRPNIELTDAWRAELDSRRGTAGFVTVVSPEGLEVPDHSDALILSTDNAMVDELSSN
jgi:hypothetical protein